MHQHVSLDPLWYPTCYVLEDRILHVLFGLRSVWVFALDLWYVLEDRVLIWKVLVVSCCILCGFQVQTQVYF